MLRARHIPAPHYLRFARALSLAGGMALAPACAAEPAVSGNDAGRDVGPVASDASNDCQVTPQPGITGAGDGGCYYLDGGAPTRCPETCATLGGDVGAIGPLSPPDLEG